MINRFDMNFTFRPLSLLHILIAAMLGLAVRAMDPSGPDCQGAGPAIRTLLRTLEPPPADDVCPWLTVNFCNRLAVVEWGLTLTGNNTQPCESRQEPFSGTLTVFQDRRPLPHQFPDPGAVYKAEGATYYWLWKAIGNMYSIAPCGTSAQLLLPQGWQQQALFELSQGDKPSLLLGSVLLQPEERQLVIVVRGTMTQHEWALNLSYNQTAMHPFNAPVHWGFLSIFQEVWPVVQTQLDLLVPSAADQVFVTGHSLGAAVASLIAYAAQDHLDTQLGKGDAPLVSAALFAPPNVGPPEFEKAYRQLVNGRRIAFRDDAVPQVPCTPEFPACSADSLSGSFTQLNKTLIATNMPGDVDSWDFIEPGGGLLVAPSQMPQDAASWEALKEIQICWSGAFVTATHSCSYTCFTSQFGPAGAAEQSSCWLSPQPEDAVGSACPGWPAGYPGMVGDSQGALAPFATGSAHGADLESLLLSDGSAGAIAHA